MADFIDVIRRMRALSHSEENDLRKISSFLTEKQKRIVNGLLKERKIAIDYMQYSLAGIIEKQSFPQITVKKDSQAVSEISDQINKSVKEKMKPIIFKQISRNIRDHCSDLIAPNIVGFETIKKAVALQLLSPDHIHILLLGDPGTGKTQILASAAELALVSSMGLGSGTSGVGLAVTVKGNEIIKGLLPMADGGVCAIDELNLMKEESRASLYNAMERGFVSYDKGGHSYKFDARVSVISTANPKGDKFGSESLADLKKQLPFDPALLSRFHLTFIVRKHNIDEFKQITKSLLGKKKEDLSSEEKRLLKEYIAQAHSIEVKLPTIFEQEIVDFIAELKKQENNYLTEISPRIVVGFTRMAKAAARMELRSEVSQKDVDLVKDIFQQSLDILA